jgi:uncharacterized protein (TIGR03435 family)
VATTSHRRVYYGQATSEAAYKRQSHEAGVISPNAAFGKLRIPDELSCTRGECASPSFSLENISVGKNGRLVEGSRNSTMTLLAEGLSRKVGRLVVDRSGITDRIDYRFEWTLEANDQLPPGVQFQADPNPVTVIDAVREQLGLKLQSTKGSVRTLVIDHIERPSEN